MHPRRAAVFAGSLLLLAVAGKKIGPRDGATACIALARWYVS